VAVIVAGLPIRMAALGIRAAGMREAGLRLKDGQTDDGREAKKLAGQHVVLRVASGRKILAL
jgi:hypothetical protein